MKKKTWKSYSQKKHISSETRQSVIRAMKSPISRFFFYLQWFFCVAIGFITVVIFWGTGHILLGLIALCVLAFWIWILYSYLSYYRARKKTLYTGYVNLNLSTILPTQNEESEIDDGCQRPLNDAENTESNAESDRN